MIQMIAGTYGYRDGDRVIPKTSASGPFSLPPGRERELVEAGIARYVDGFPLSLEAAPQTSDYIDLPEYGVDMKFDELKSIAKIYGVDEDRLKAAKSKAAVVALIDELVASQADDTEDDDPPPPPLGVEVPR